MDYPISVPGVGLVGGKFTDGNPLLSLPASLDPASWANAVTDELLNVIRAAAIEPAEAVTTQLLAAITALARGVLPKRSFTANDFVRIPDVPGGLILQWGFFPCGAVTGGTIPYPVAFPTNMLGQQICSYNDAHATNEMCWLTTSPSPYRTALTFGAANTNGASAVRWWAVGY